MAKRPTPKKHRPKSRTRTQRSAYLASEVKRLRQRASSPYSKPATSTTKGQKALEKITKIKA